MGKLRNFLIALAIFSGSGFLQPAAARESFYNLSTTEPSIIVNLGALDRLEPVYTPPPQPLAAKTSRTKTRSYATAQPSRVKPVIKQMPVVSDDIEPPSPPPPAPVKPLAHAAPPLPVVSPELTPSAPISPPSSAAQPVKITHMAPPTPPLAQTEETPVPPLPTPPPVLKSIGSNPPPLIAAKTNNNNTLPDLPPPPLPTPALKPSVPNPPPMISAKVNTNTMPDLPPPPPLPKVDVLPEAPDIQNSTPQIIVSAHKPPQVTNQLQATNTPQVPKAAAAKANDNIVALPAPPPPPQMPVNKTPDNSAVAVNKDLSLPPPLPTPPPGANDTLTLPPPLPPPPSPDDIDKKIADEKASINAEQVNSKAAVKSAAAKMPTPKDLANTPPPSLADLPPMPPPPLNANNLPPLSMAQNDSTAQPVTQNDATAAKSPSTAVTDLPPLPNLPSSSPASTTPPANSVPSKETVTIQPDKLPSTTGNNGVITMPYSEAETDVPLVEKAKLDSVVAQLQSDKTKTVTLIAYASGTPEQASQAKRTSLARVLAVRKYLMEQNIDPERINPRPLGNHAEGGVPDRVDIIVQNGGQT